MKNDMIALLGDEEALPDVLKVLYLNEETIRTEIDQLLETIKEIVQERNLQAQAKTFSVKKRKALKSAVNKIDRSVDRLQARVQAMITERDKLGMMILRTEGMTKVQFIYSAIEMGRSWGFKQLEVPLNWMKAAAEVGVLLRRFCLRDNVALTSESWSPVNKASFYDSKPKNIVVDLSDNTRILFEGPLSSAEVYFIPSMANLQKLSIV